MRVLIGDEWLEGFLDEHRPAGAVRLDVRALATCRPLTDLFFVRERSWFTLWNTVREVGPVWLVRKVASRRKEGSRNAKYLSLGLGVVRESDAGSALAPGTQVVFVAPAHPRAVERIVLDAALVLPLARPRPAASNGGVVVVSDDLSGVAGSWDEFAAWSAFASSPLDPARTRAMLVDAASALDNVSWSAGLTLPVPAGAAPRERDSERPSRGGRSAVLFGYGHYGRAVVLPNVARVLSVDAVHEIDPTLLGTAADALRRDTAPIPRADERYDVYLIASYHHTHVPLAVHALNAGATAVVEKPIATTREQLGELVAALERTGGRLFAGFHKRYSPLNALALADLRTQGSEPIHYHAIVFEEPLPRHHWYRWPSSRSRIVSNGCHWLDHFLFLNDWSEPVGWTVSRGGADGEIANVSVRLANGAFFSMLLTDAGSARIGVRDYIELRSGGVTVTIHNGSRYVAEDRRRILRRTRVNKMTSYESMYRTIAARIARGATGDSVRSVRVSTALVLSVEEAFAAQKASPASGGPPLFGPE